MARKDLDPTRGTGQIDYAFLGLTGPVAVRWAVTTMEEGCI